MQQEWVGIGVRWKVTFYDGTALKFHCFSEEESKARQIADYRYLNVTDRNKIIKVEIDQ